MREVEILGNIDSCLKELKEKAIEYGEDCRMKFNDSYLLSTDTIDDAYKRILGKSKEEFEGELRRFHEEYERREAEFKAKIPQLTEEYRSEARGLVEESELECWDKIVPIRLGDLYHGMELECTLNLCKVMRDDSLVFAARLEKAYDLFQEQGHSGTSAGLVMSMLRRSALTVTNLLMQSKNGVLKRVKKSRIWKVLVLCYEREREAGTNEA